MRSRLAGSPMHVGWPGSQWWSGRDGSELIERDFNPNLLPCSNVSIKRMNNRSIVLFLVLSDPQSLQCSAYIGEIESQCFFTIRMWNISVNFSMPSANHAYDRWAPWKLDGCKGGSFPMLKWIMPRHQYTQFEPWNRHYICTIYCVLK